MKKRRNIVVDDELLERAKRVLGEKTYSGAVTKALEHAVKQGRAWEAYRKFEEMAHSEEGFFDPDFLKERADQSLLLRDKRRMSAHEVRAPRSSGKRRGPG